MEQKPDPQVQLYTVMVAKSHPNFCSIFKIFMTILLLESQDLEQNAFCTIPEGKRT